MKFEPVRFSTAINLFGIALISLFGLLLGWTAIAVVAVNAVWAAAKGVFDSFIVRNAVTPNENLDGIVHDTIMSLAPFAPEVVPAIVPVAVSPLIDGPQVVDAKLQA